MKLGGAPLSGALLFVKYRFSNVRRPSGSPRLDTSDNLPYILARRWKRILRRRPPWGW